MHLGTIQGARNMIIIVKIVTKCIKIGKFENTWKYCMEQELFQGNVRKLKKMQGNI
jgi:hypothetical protein